MVFSDEMFVYQKLGQKQPVIILITDHSFLVLSKTYGLVKQMHLSDLKTMVSISSNSSLMSLKFRDSSRDTFAGNVQKDSKNQPSKDIIVETFRRSELILFLIKNAQINNRSKPQFLMSNIFKIGQEVIDFTIQDD